jgi:hypothetical protein
MPLARMASGSREGQRASLRAGARVAFGAGWTAIEAIHVARLGSGHRSSAPMRSTGCTASGWGAPRRGMGSGAPQVGHSAGPDQWVAL